MAGLIRLFTLSEPAKPNRLWSVAAVWIAEDNSASLHNPKGPEPLLSSNDPASRARAIRAREPGTTGGFKT
jgi:hypothetical protein